MIDRVPQEVSGLAWHLPIDTPSKSASESRAENQAVDAGYNLVNANPLVWAPAQNAFQLSTGQSGAPIEGQGARAGVIEADHAGRIAAGIG
jgi:hypothetical protein